jgi:DNA-binding CsgD family transcriptional regulator
MGRDSQLQTGAGRWVRGTLTLQILAGGSTADMAARLNVSVNTLKTQLQAAYAKTRTNRQVDMLKLLLSLATV